MKYIFLQLAGWMVILFSVFFLLGCREELIMDEVVIIEEEEEQEEICPSVYYADTIFLTSETISKFPYPENYPANSIFFEDSIGNRVLAHFPTDEPTVHFGGRFPNTVPCVHDTTKQVSVEEENGIIGRALIIDELGLEFVVGYRVGKDILRYEDQFFYESGRLLVSSEIDDPYFIIPIPQTLILLNENNWQRNTSFNYAVLNSEVSLNGKIFYDVYKNNVGAEKFELYFNFEKGIVGFMDQRDGVLYSLVE